MDQNQVFCEGTVLQNRTVPAPAIGNALQYELNADQVLTLSVGNAEHPDWFIQEYAGGRRILVSIDTTTGGVHFLRNL